MVFKIDRDFLYNRFQYAREISENGHINVYYSYFIFEVTKNALCIKSADRFTTLEITIVPNKENQLDIVSEGSMLLPGTKIHNVFSSLPPGIVTLSLVEQSVVITPEKDTNKIEFSVRTRDAEDYPAIHLPMPEEKYKVDKQELIRIITSTVFAASSDTNATTLFLTGIFFDFKDSHLIAVATDRNRISIAKMKLEHPIDLQIAKSNDVDLIIPSRSINFIKSLLIRENTEVEIGQKDNRVYFLLEGFLVSVNIISGKYYNYENILPEKTNPTGERSSVKVNTKEFTQALERVSSIADDKKDTVIKLSIQSNTVIISKEEKEKGYGTETISGELTGKEKDLNVRAHFLIEPLRVIESEYISIDYGEGNRDLIRIQSPSEKDTMHLAVPITAI